jgi:hypothetical protein
VGESNETGISTGEIQLARARIRTWPREDRESLVRLSEPEVEAIMLATALLDLTPVDPAEIPADAIHIDLR